MYTIPQQFIKPQPYGYLYSTTDKENSKWSWAVPEVTPTFQVPMYSEGQLRQALHDVLTTVADKCFEIEELYGGDSRSAHQCARTIINFRDHM